MKAKKSTIQQARDHGVDLSNRWCTGIKHHPKSRPFMEALREIDSALFDDYFDWHLGGDGDNGETFMYQLDIIFELQDKKFAARKKAAK